MKVVTIDAETYYERGEYSLRNMPTQQYINDPRFQIIGIAVAVNGGTPTWYSFDNIIGYVAALGKYELEKEGTITVAHNAMFDGAILEWILGIKPWRYFCTMAGSRPYVAPYTGRMSLESVAQYLNLGVKGKEVFGAHDKRLADFNEEELKRYAAYCVNDVVLSWKIFRYVAMQMPASERRIVDLTVKKFTRPKLLLDKKVIEGALDEVRADKAELLAKAGLESPDALMSNPMFAELLTQHGVDPPMKISPATGKTTHAFAKSDPTFMALLTAVNPQVRALMRARLKFKSTIEETRLERFRVIHGCTKTHELAAPLLYYGAHPGRFSGLDKLNLQNLGRTSPLRRAISAPPGYKIIAGDLSQIEARITACLAGQNDLVELFRYYDNLESSDRDVYCEFGDSVYAREITVADKLERFVSKTGVLSLGYQSGAKTFHEAMLGFGIDDYTFADAQAVVTTYRTRFNKIPQLWQQMENMIRAMQSGADYRIGPVSSATDRVKLPNGMFLTYNSLTNAGGRFKYKFGTEWRDIYGGKLTENVVQALARIIMTDAELRLAKAGLTAALSVHDELIFVVPDDKVEVVKKALRMALTAKVPWMPDLPVNCEIGTGDNYAEAK